MRKLIDPKLMRQCEAECFRTSGVPSIDVMERAARELANVALDRFPEARRVYVACGPGGNGGDGYACARLLRDAGLEVHVFPSAPAKSPDATANAVRARACGIPFHEPPRSLPVIPVTRAQACDMGTSGGDSSSACSTPDASPAQIASTLVRPAPEVAGPGIGPNGGRSASQASPLFAQAPCKGGRGTSPVSACSAPDASPAQIAGAQVRPAPEAAGLNLGANFAGIESGGDSIPDLWIDCLYGTGLSRAPSGKAAELIERMNIDRVFGVKVLAADIPSGLNGRTGARFSPCVEADCTVSFQFAKLGHVLGDGLDLCGKLVVADVGFPEEAFPADLPRLIEPADLRALFAPRRRNIHKGRCGHLLIVAGSMGMAGAAALCAGAALRGGVGLVTLACPASIVPILQTLVPCAMCLPLPERDGALSMEAVGPLRAAISGKSAVIIGPGLTRRAPAEIVQAVLESGLPAVIDADALNLLAAHPELMSKLRPHLVLTPHPGEAARLLNHPCADPLTDARELAELGTTAVLKGASRVIVGAGEVYISASGAPGMARGGSGDVYAGILGALLAESSARTPAQSAAAACELHGIAGELAQAKYGPRAMNSADLLEFLPEAIGRIDSESVAGARS